jgi:hypothetical protein
MAEEDEEAPPKREARSSMLLPVETAVVPVELPVVVVVVVV